MFVSIFAIATHQIFVGNCFISEQLKWNLKAIFVFLVFDLM
jgi:hypothetical protein